MRAIHEIIVHASATRPDWMQGEPLDQKIKEIDRWHRARGWESPSGIAIGYHFVIDRDGQIGKGRPVSEVGAHIAGRNATTIGVCLLGGFGGNADDPFREHFTTEQEVSLRSLLADLQSRYGIRKVAGHNEYAAKACPCFNVSEWLGVDPPKMGRPTLKLGSHGIFVRELQTILHDLRFHSGEIDDDFGPITEESVMGFQRANGLRPDGIVGPKTWGVLETDPKPRPLRNVSTKSLREAGSRTIAAADRSQIASAGAGAASLAGAVATLRTELTATQEGLQELSAAVEVTGPLEAAMPYILSVLGLAVAALAVWSFINASRVKAARVDDGVQARNLGR